MHKDLPRQPLRRFKALLPAIAAFVLCVLSLAPAQAQTFRIDPVNPTAFTGGASVRARGDESVQPQFRVTLTGGTAGQNYSVNIQVQPVASAAPTAPQDGVDYRGNSVPQTITLQPGGTNTFTLRVFDDESFEQLPENRNTINFDEQLSLTLNNPSNGANLANGTNGPQEVTYGIIDNDARPRIRVRDVALAVQDRTNEARFVEGNSTTPQGQTFQVELVGASGFSGFLNDSNVLVRTTSIETVQFDFDYQNGDGTDPTVSGQRAPDAAALGTDFLGSFDNQDLNGGTPVPAQIAAGQSFTTIPFRVVGDTQDENNETFIVRILNPINPNNGVGGLSSVSNPEGTRGFGVILDDDAPVVTISNASVTEGNLGSSTTATFRLELSAPSVQPVQVVFFTTDGTAFANVIGPNTVSDYVGTSGTRTFQPGVTEQFINVTVNGDNISEGGTNGFETFNLTLQPFPIQFYGSNPEPRDVDNPNFTRSIPETQQRGLLFSNSTNTGSTAGTGAAVGTIIDDDVTTISIGDAQVVEGDGTGQTVLIFPITLTSPSQNATTVTATTAPGAVGPNGATEGADFVATSQLVTIAAGATSGQFQVLVNNDNLDELNETFFVNLTNNSVGTAIPDAQAIGIIIDNDGPTISINNVTVAEGIAGGATGVASGSTGTTPVTLTVTLSAASPQTVTVNYRTTDGSATSSGLNPDFQAVPVTPVQTITFAPGVTSQPIVVNVTADTIFEPNETFNVLLSGATNAAPTPFTSSTGVVTITNDDATPSVSIVDNLPDDSTADVSTTEGGNAVFTIALSNPSSQAITVTFQTQATNDPNSATPGADFTAITGGTVTFGAATATAAGQTTSTVAVPTVNDSIEEPNEQFNLFLTGVSNNATIGDPVGTATIIDNETVNLSVGDASATEGDSGATNISFPVTLGSASASPITLTFTTTNGTATSPSDFTGTTTGTVIIPAGATTGTITIPIIGDVVAENTELFTLNVTADARAATVTRGTATGTIVDNDTASIIVTPTTITTAEAGTGNTATFTVRLTSQPTGNVTIPVTSSNTREATVSTPSLVFTPNTFSAPQTVTVTGVDDTLVDGPVGYTIVLGAAQSSDPFFANRKPSDVAGTNTDNDIAALFLTIPSANINEGATTTATVSRNTQNNGLPLVVNLTSSNPGVTVPASVTIPAGVTSINFTVTSADNDIVDGTRTSIISATAAGFTASNGVLVTVSDNESAGVTVTPTTLSTSEGGTSAIFTVRLTSQPSANVTITFSSSNEGEVTVSPATVTFTPSTFATPQTITVTGVDDDVVDGASTAVIRGAITSADTNYSRLTVAPVTVTNADNDRAAFTVTPVSGLMTDEAGRTATFTVAINSTPTAVVTVAVASSDTTEATVFPGTLTFSPQDRNPKTVIVTGLDDLNADGTVPFRIVLSPAVSNDDKYSGVDPTDVAVTNADNDSASIVVSTRALTTTEAGGTDAFTVSLTSQPIANVTVNAFSTDNTEGTTEPSTLIFTPANYATPQTVLVRGIDDKFVDGSVLYGVRLGAVSQDPGYADQALPTIGVTNVDNDSARVVVTVPAAGIRINENGNSATFTVNLVGQPASTVTLPLSLDKPGEARLSTPSLSFTPDNFSTPKTVTVTGLNDFIADGNQSFTITLGPTRSGDPAFNLLRPTSVRGVNSDNDRAGVSLSPTSLTLREGARGTITISLLSQPTAPVRLTLQSSDTTEVVVPSTVVLNASNYRTGVAVPVTAVADGVVDGQTIATVRVASQASADRLYNVTNSAVTGARVTVTDANVASIRVSATALTVDENGSVTFQVSLGARPSGPVRVLVASSAPGVGTVSPTTLTFTAANFNRPQTVTVRGVNNTTVQSTPATFNVTTTASGSNFSASGANVVVTVADDDDATAPSVTIEGPANGGTFQSVTAVTGVTTDDRRLTRLTIEVARLNAAGNAVAYLQSSGVFSSAPTARTVTIGADGSFTLPLPRLELGRYRITALAFDQSNNVGRDVSTFTISDAPTTIAITSPRTGGAINPASVITGTVTTRTTLTALTLTLRSASGSTRKLNVTRSGNTFTSDAIGALAQGTYTIIAMATDAQGNTVTSSVSVLIDSTPPTSVAITNLAPNQVVDNIFEIRGRVTDAAGGSGLDRVELVIKRRTDNTFFNGRTFQRAATTVRATIEGNTFVYRLPSGLPADPDPLNAVYSLQAIAFDRAGNGRSSAAVNVLLSTNGNAGNGTTGNVVSTPSTTTTSVAVASPFELSTRSASAAQVTISFTGLLDNAGASDVSSYEVSINGQLVKIEGARSSGNSLTLSLPSGQAVAGDTVEVAYNLHDAQGRFLNGQTSAIVH